jgi:hypothetical protein
MIDEDETHEVIALGESTVAILRTGLDLAMLRTRGAYIAGHISVEQFESEVERLLRKRADLSA